MSDPTTDALVVGRPAWTNPRGEFVGFLAGTSQPVFAARLDDVAATEEPAVLVGAFKANTIAFRADPAMAPAFKVRDLFPASFALREPPDYSTPRPPPPPPVLKPTPLYDFLLARAAASGCKDVARLLYAVLEVHKPYGTEHGTWQIDRCDGCGTTSYMDDPVAPHTDACVTLRAIAAPFADHPGFPTLREVHEYQWDF